MEEEKRQEFYRVMLHDSERLLSTIEQVLRTGRVGHSRRKQNVVDIDVGERRRLARRDLDEVQAAVSNLIDNAVKYSGKDIRVRVELGNRNGNYAVLRVTDQGVGIPRTELKRVFKRFYRVPGPLAARIKGTGLGLFIVRSVAKRHGGRTWAESEGPGRGSTFVLQFPIAS